MLSSKFQHSPFFILHNLYPHLFVRTDKKFKTCSIANGENKYRNLLIGKFNYYRNYVGLALLKYKLLSHS